MSKFSELINSGKPVLVDFFANWCVPCKTMEPILHHVSAVAGNRAHILKVDIEKNPVVAERYKIRGVPTLILFKRGEVMWRQSGVTDETELLNIISNYS